MFVLLSLPSTLVVFFFFVVLDLPCIVSASTLRSGPIFLMEPSTRVEFLNSDGGSVHCTAHGHPQPVVKWITGDGSDVYDVSNLRRVLRNGTMMFGHFPSEMYRQDIHATVYRCLASNVYGRIISNPVTVRAAMKQNFQGQVYDRYIISGNTAVFQCRIPSYATDDITVNSWLTSDDAVITLQSTLEKPRSRYSIFTNGYLHVKNVEHGDNGERYFCEMRHKLSGDVLRSSTSGTLYVKEPRGSTPPQILHIEQEIRVELGDVAQIPCVAQGYPPPSNRWFIINTKGDRYHIKGSHKIRITAGSLIIFDTSSEDNGLYECYMTNSVGNHKVRTRLIVSSMLSIEIRPKRQTIDVGKPATITCIVRGGPIETLQWTRNGLQTSDDDRHLSLSSTKRQLKIESLRRNDGGMYQCLAANDISSVQATSQLFLGDVYPVFVQRFKSQVFQPGPFVTLKCVSTGTPFPTIKWLRDGQLVHDSNDYRIGMYTDESGYTVGHLNITQIQVKDGGLYTCEATNKAGSEQHSSRIDVYGLPHVRKMGNISVTAEEPFRIRCHSYGYPIETYTWLKDEEIIQNNTEHIIFNNGSVHFRKAVSKVHDGKYTCIAKNRQNQRAQGDLWVKIIVKPKVGKMSFPEHVRVGMQVGLYCGILEGNQPLTKTWLKDGSIISVDQNIIITETGSASLLEIKRVLKKHNGNYTCIADNEAGSSNYTAVLQVEASPTWLIKPDDKIVAVKETAVFNCVADGHPAPSHNWRRKLGNEFVDIVNTVKHIVHRNGTLEIINVTVNDNGLYRCDVTNGIIQPINRVVRLTAGFPPKLTAKNRIIRIEVNSEAVLSCEISGNYPLLLTWQKEDSKTGYRNTIKHDRHRLQIITRPNVNGIGKISELKILKTSNEDMGYYYCNVNNTFGLDEANIELIIEDVPGPVHGAKLYGYGNRSVRAVWKYPEFDGNSPVLGYIVRYGQKFEQPSNRMTTSVDGRLTSVLLERITLHKHYEIWITAANKHGSSIKSNYRIDFILSENGTIILPESEESLSGLNGLLVLLIVPIVLLLILLCSVAFIIIFVIRRKKKNQLMRPEDVDRSRKSKRFYDKNFKFKEQSLNDLKNKTDRYGQLLPPNSEQKLISSENVTYDVVKNSGSSTPTDGHYSEVSPYATFHLAGSMDHKDKPIELKTFTPRNSSEMSSVL